MFILFIPEKIKGILLPTVSGASSSNIVDCFLLLQASLNHTHTHTHTQINKYILYVSGGWWIMGGIEGWYLILGINKLGNVTVR